MSWKQDALWAFKFFGTGLLFMGFTMIAHHFAPYIKPYSLETCGTISFGFYAGLRSAHRL